MNEITPNARSLTMASAETAARKTADAMRDLSAKMNRTRRSGDSDVGNAGSDFLYHAGDELSSVMTAVRSLGLAPSMAEWFKLWPGGGVLGGQVLGGLVSSLRNLQTVDRSVSSFGQGSSISSTQPAFWNTSRAVVQFAECVIMFLQRIVLPALKQAEDRDRSHGMKEGLAGYELQALIAATRPDVDCPVTAAWARTWPVGSTPGGLVLDNLQAAVAALSEAEGARATSHGSALLPAVVQLSERVVDLLQLLIVTALPQAVQRDGAIEMVERGRAWFDESGNIISGRRPAACPQGDAV